MVEAGLRMSELQAGRPSQRDPRVDVLRGLALVMIFIDHVPGNALSWVTLHMFGFSDAAELFVILSGFSSMVAYGRSFERGGVRVGLSRIIARCLRLYVFQAGLLLLTFLIVKAWSAHYEMLIPDLIPFLSNAKQLMRHGLALRALPAKLDILPLYIVLLGLFPVIYLGVRKSLWITLALSGSLWLAANLVPGLNFSNWLTGDGWYFNPFAWQFLFVIGAAGAREIGRGGGSLPRINWLAWSCWAYLAFALLVSAPWASWGWLDFHPIPLATPDKSNLAPLRLLHILALVYLALSSPGFLALVRRGWLAGIDACGRHSLEIFSLATLLAVVGGLLTTTFGTYWQIQIAINGVGLAMLIGAAKLMEVRRSRLDSSRWRLTPLWPTILHMMADRKVLAPALAKRTRL
jgi:hypothetical protein